MSDVIRYEPTYSGMNPDKMGSFVDYEDYEDLEKEVKTLRGDLKWQMELKQNHINKCVELRARAEQAEADLRRCKEDIAYIVEKHDSSQIINQELKAERDALKAEVETWIERSDQTLEDNTRLKKERDELKAEVEDLKAEVERQRTKLDRVLYLGAQFYMMKADNPKREKLWQEFSDLKYPKDKTQKEQG